MTVFAQIQACIADTIRAVPGIDPARVLENRRRPLSAAVDWAIAVSQLETQQTSSSLSMLKWATTYSLECYARSTAAMPASQRVDELVGLIFPVMFDVPALSALGAMNMGQPAGIQWDYDETTDVPVVVATLAVVVQHATLPNLLIP